MFVQFANSDQRFKSIILVLRVRGNLMMKNKYVPNSNELVRWFTAFICDRFIHLSLFGRFNVCEDLLLHFRNKHFFHLAQTVQMCFFFLKFVTWFRVYVCLVLFFLCCSLWGRRMKRNEQKRWKNWTKGKQQNCALLVAVVQRRRYQFLHIIKHCNGFSNTCTRCNMHTFSHLSISLINSPLPIFSFEVHFL